MKTRIQIALMGALVSVGVHLYLTMHYYPIKLGLTTEQSICSLNAKFDCDAVAASSFATVFGMPLAIWGAATNAVLFVMILLSWLEWTDEPERFKRWTFVLTGITLGASIVMGTIAFTQMSAYCLFCMAVYALSFIVFFSYRAMPERPIMPALIDDLKHLGALKAILIAYAAIPILAILGHRMFLNDMGADKIEAMVQEAVQEWQGATKQEFVAKPSLVAGPPPEQAAMTLVEFADFRCGHCRHASYTLDRFVKSHPDVRFEFYSFPLDGACNEKIQVSSGVSCRLASAVVCAEKEGKGWDLHHKLYAVQDEVNRLPSTTELEPFLQQTTTGLGLNWEKLQACMNDPTTSDAVRAQAKQGGLVNVQGTPTMFVNGRLLNGGQVLPVLQAVRLSSLQSKSSNK